MDYQTKTLCVLKEINDAMHLQTGRENHDIHSVPTFEIRATGEHIKHLHHDEIKTILRKLEKEKIIRVEEWGNNRMMWPFQVAPTKLFQPYLDELRGSPDMQSSQQPTPLSGVSDSSRALWITYDEYTRQIVLNGIILLSTPRLNSINHLVFAYLYANPYREITDAELAQSIAKQKRASRLQKGDEPRLDKAAGEKTMVKRYHDILRDLGFKGAFAKAFFSFGKGSITFRRRLSPKQRDESDLGYFRLKQLKEK